MAVLSSDKPKTGSSIIDLSIISSTQVTLAVTVGICSSQNLQASGEMLFLLKLISLGHCDL